MSKFRNLGRLLQEQAHHAKAAALDPIPIEGEGEATYTDIGPVTSRGEDVVYDTPGDGVNLMEGLDLRGDAPAPRAPHPAPVPVAESDEEVPESLKGALAGLGGVADRAQASMDGPERSSGLRGFMAQAAGSAAMGAGAKSPAQKQTVPPNGAAVPPEVAKFASEKMEDPIAKARRQANIERGLSAMTDNVHAGMDIATRMKTPGYGNAMRDDADRIEGDAKDQVAQAKEFALKKLGLKRQEEVDALNKRKVESEINKNDREGQPKAAKPKERDSLADEKTQAEIAEIKARTEKLGRHGGAGGGAPSLGDQKKQLEIDKLKREADGDPFGVPGFSRRPDAPHIKPEEAEAMRAMMAAQQGIEAPISAMETAKKNTGRETSFFGLGEGEDYAAQTGPYSQMILNVKDLAKSGALDEQSERVAQGMVPTPSDSPEAAAEKIKSLRTYVKSKVEAKAASLGYVSGTSSGLPTLGAEAPHPTGRVKTDKQGVQWEELSDGTARKKVR